MIKSRVKKLILPAALMLLFVCPFIGLLLANADEVMSGGGYAVTGQLSETGYTSVVYDANNGLPTSDANYIYSADDGFMWIGGYSGIFRYDGSVFERLDATDGLTSGRVIFEDSSNRIWVGTNDNGVVMLDNGVSTHITYNEGLPSSSIRAFAEDNDGNIIVGSTAGISYIDKDNIVHTIDNEELNTKRIVRL
ncbi:MAG: hybrid sensor histidine kinase/response regulator, partial [Lachnospiraceae bacterium]|nr:hybrid sensor histidine kinase/response regulator [Lachnospiraceae bacterium]